MYLETEKLLVKDVIKEAKQIISLCEENKLLAVCTVVLLSTDRIVNAILQRKAGY